jgi:nitrate reductase gamma subunit
MKWTTLSALAAGFIAKGPAVVAVVSVSVVVVVIATYILVARRSVAPRLRWGGLKIDFTRVPRENDSD